MYEFGKAGTIAQRPCRVPFLYGMIKKGNSEAGRKEARHEP